MSVPDDGALIGAVLAHRDDRAFSVLYDRHATYLWRLALRLAGGDDAMAEEIAHDAWVRAAERLARFAGRSAFRTWLAGFAVNVARELQRGDVHETCAEELSSPRDDVTAVDARVDVSRALARLSPGYRRVVVLHDLEGFTHEEIAAMLGVDAGTSKSQLARARRRLRRLLEGDTP